MSVTQGQLDWLVNDFIRDTPGVLHALVVSGDGLLLASSANVEAMLGDQLSAATAGLVSLSKGAAQLLGLAPVSQTIIEMTGGYLFATSISQGSTLAVVAQRHCDMGMVGYEMTMLASRVGHALTPAPRSGQPHHVQPRPVQPHPVQHSSARHSATQEWTQEWTLP